MYGRPGLVRRRPLLRAAAIGGTFAAGRAVGRRAAEQASAESYQDQRSADLEGQQSQPLLRPSDEPQQDQPLLRAAPDDQQNQPLLRPSDEPQQDQPLLRAAPDDQQNQPLLRPSDEPQQDQPLLRPAPPEPDAGRGSATDQLSKLAELHQQGELTDEEFAAAKTKILGAG
jgi:hypothetical protein